MHLRPARKAAHSFALYVRNQRTRFHSLPTLLLLLALLCASIPTPDVSAAATLALPTFSVPHGLYTSSFKLALSATAGSTIRYTLDGSTPSPTVGTVYSAPITINATKAVRAIAYTSATTTSFVATQTYIFLADVKTQSDKPAGWPTKFAADDADGTYPADYGMDPEVWNHPNNSGKYDSVMKSLPSLSIVTDLPNLWDPSYGIYYNPNAKDPDPMDPKGTKWERPISLEWLDQNGTSAGFSANGGLRINGQASRRPLRQPKKSFRVYFKTGYGTPKLDFQLFDYADAVSKFDRIVLRNGGNRSWSYFDRDQRREADYVNDEWARRAWLQMGNLAPHGTYVHLYINGLYWGLYNVTERIDTKFVQAYMGGSDTEYSTVEADEDLDDAATADPPETIDAWNAVLNAVAGEQPITNAQYADIETKVDVENLADYFVHVHYIGKTDWPAHNWNAFRKLTGPDTRFKFIPWDNDSGFNKVTENTTIDPYMTDVKGPADAPVRIFKRLTSNPEFVRVLADRLYKHAIDTTGALAPTSCAATYKQLTDIIDQAVIGESARWGDYMRDTYPVTNTLSQEFKQLPAYLYSRDLPPEYTGPPKPEEYSSRKTWVKVRDEKLTNYCPQRSNVLMGQYVANGWYQTTVKPPLFSQTGGAVAANYNLSISNSPNVGVGDIYYTTDGSDPRVEFGSVATTALNGADLVNLPITQVTKVRARVLNGSTWSPLVEYTFYPPQPFENLVISEVQYSPIAPATPIGEDPDDYEFVELHNNGTTPLRLDNASFAHGISYHFPENTTIWPDQYMVLASKDGKFKTQYGFSPFGNYRGNLANIGEAIELVDALGKQIDLVNYLPTAPWPTGANGSGASMCLPNLTADNNLGANWKASGVGGGTPGAAGCDSANPAKPAVWLGPASLNFGEQPIGEPSLAQVTTLANAGATPLTISSIVAGGDFAQTNACPAVLAVSASCTVSVRFTPSDRQARTGSVVVTSDAPASPHSINVSGIGVAGARTLTLSTNAMDFGTQTVGTTSAPKEVQVTNIGSLAVDLVGIATTNDFAQTSTCPASLASGASCTISVSFTPSTAEAHDGSLVMNSNAPTTPQRISLHGVGIGGAHALSLSATSLDFRVKAVGETSAPQVVTITNAGTTALAISTIATQGNFAQTNTCASSLDAGASCTVTITYAPATAGTHKGTLSITSDADGSPHTVALNGIVGDQITSSGYRVLLPIVIR